MTTLWNIDPMHTTVGFSVRHLMITTVRGSFEGVSGSVRYDPRDPTAIALDAEIPAQSIHTRQPQRDAHLRSADFFDAERHPTIRFRSTGVRAPEAGPLEVIGELSIRGTTREVVLAVHEITGPVRDHNGQARMGASATGQIKRSEFGMTYNKLLEAGRVAIGDEISLTLDVSLVAA